MPEDPSDVKPYRYIDLEDLEEIEQAERPDLRIRWWVLPFAAILCVAQVALCLLMENVGVKMYPIATQISVPAFGFFAIVAILLNPWLRFVRRLNQRPTFGPFVRIVGLVAACLLAAAFVRLGAGGETSQAAGAAPLVALVRVLTGAGVVCAVAMVFVVKPLNRGELMALFAAMAVTAGIVTFGLADQLLPLIVAPFNNTWNIPQRKWDTDVIPHLNPKLFITDNNVIEQFRVGFDTDKGLLRRIPWMAWARPVGLWMIFVFAVYMLFYSLSSLVYDSWARREKLVFPLARLPEDLIHDEERPAGSMPLSLRTAAFWIGFAIAFFLLLYNGCCQAGWIRGMKPLAMGVRQSQLVMMLHNTIFEGIADGGQFRLMFMVTLTGVGIGFLLPLDISRSLWAYFAIGMALMMIAIWCAVASSVRSFRSDWLWENNFVSSMGAGGLLAFSAVCLGKLAHERWAVTRDASPDLDGAPLVIAFLRSFGTGGLFFLISVAVTVGWLHWSGVRADWALLFLAIMTLMIVGLMRVVAEGGVYWFQIHTGPFHLAKMAGGAKYIPAGVLAPLMPIYSVLFLDIKTFMAPAALNSYKMQEETRASRRMFHFIVVVCILAAVVASLGGTLYLIYEIGANRGSGWFWTRGPQSLLDQTQRLVSGALAETGRYNWIFYLVGATWVILSVAMRRRFFWWLHPIGFAMLANPLMTQLWFSFFLGWIFKKITVKYGGRHTFAKVRPFFMGLILGEILMIFAWMVVAQWLNLRVSMTLNRYGP